MATHGFTREQVGLAVNETDGNPRISQRDVSFPVSSAGFRPFQRGTLLTCSCGGDIARETYTFCLHTFTFVICKPRVSSTLEVRMWDLKSVVRKDVRVRLPPSAPDAQFYLLDLLAVALRPCHN